MNTEDIRQIVSPSGRATPDCDRIEEGKTYSTADVARLVFHITRATFHNNRKELHALDAFPRPISRIGQARWSGKDLLDWMNRPKIDAAELRGPKVLDFSATLKERARSLARRD